MQKGRSGSWIKNSWPATMRPQRPWLLLPHHKSRNHLHLPPSSPQASPSTPPSSSTSSSTITWFQLNLSFRRSLHTSLYLPSRLCHPPLRLQLPQPTGNWGERSVADGGRKATWSQDHTRGSDVGSVGAELPGYDRGGRMEAHARGC